MAGSLQQCPAHPGFAGSFVHLCSGKSGRIMVAFEGTSGSASAGMGCAQGPD